MMQATRKDHTDNSVGRLTIYSVQILFYQFGIRRRICSPGKVIQTILLEVSATPKVTKSTVKFLSFCAFFSSFCTLERYVELMPCLFVRIFFWRLDDCWLTHYRRQSLTKLRRGRRQNVEISHAASAVVSHTWYQGCHCKLPRKSPFIRARIDVWLAPRHRLGPYSLPLKVGGSLPPCQLTLRFVEVARRSRKWR